MGPPKNAAAWPGFNPAYITIFFRLTTKGRHRVRPRQSEDKGRAEAVVEDWPEACCLGLTVGVFSRQRLRLPGRAPLPPAAYLVRPRHYKGWRSGQGRLVAKYKPGWRNGRRGGLKIPFLRECGFDSHLGHFLVEAEMGKKHSEPCLEIQTVFWISGMVVAAAASWQKWESPLWAGAHAACSWFYPLYLVLTDPNLPNGFWS